MNPLNPRTSHLLEQYVAWCLEVQATLKRYEDALIESGYDKGEAWELARRLEEKLIVPATHYAANALEIEEEVERVLRERLDELDGE